MKSMELLPVTGQEHGWYLLITNIGWIADNDIEGSDIGSQEIRLMDIAFKRKRKTKFYYTATARCYFCLVDIKCKYIVLVCLQKIKTEPQG